ncbi:error-prone DNA polymerase [Pseudovibrio sp. Tun.PSC04-5.I4]|uniref:error-prone DNA polymerase n=1 Tax=Pseudovibrio sp. Tun.PSC04-5.I4 TaxID=1798213 RepID=UPI000B898387|nr:error-prone DNA polymerase [Pseudovibrio sp. Tun.PSC04-5.I4]
MRGSGYAELCCATNFSFLRGASQPEELVFTSKNIGLKGLGVCDRNSLAGVVRAHVTAETAKLRMVTGARLCFIDGSSEILCWPVDRKAYGRLTQLLTIGNRRAPKGECHLRLEDLLEQGAGFIIAPVVNRLANETSLSKLKETLEALKSVFGAQVRLAVALTYGANDRRFLLQMMELADFCGLRVLAVNDVLYHEPARRPLHDIMSCIRLHETLESAGRKLEANAERYLKTYEEMAHLFQDCPEALSESLRILDEIDFKLSELKYDYPKEEIASGLSPQEELARLAEEGAHKRYPAGVPESVNKSICYELSLIEELKYAPYFLTVYDIVRFARSKGILCQGRGSAANSVVCFCIGITEVDPKRAGLLFERFISVERKEPPDIDVDFEHERREEVIQYIYQKYGRERAGLAATVITYRSRSALREVAKVFGLSEDAAGALSGTVWGRSSRGGNEDQIREAGLDPEEVVVSQVLKYARELIGFPRHLSQHVGGFVITQGRLDEVVPVMNAAMEGRTTIEWDKDDLEALGLLKIDVLALGMLTAIRKALDLLRDNYDQDLTIGSIPPEDGDVYDMICRADTLGVFQIESRAQMSMLPRLRPREFYDLVIEVAIVRPGPIQGDMVHPYLRRRQKKEAVHYPKEELRDVLGKTLGVPLFQEQAMKIAIVAADFTPGEADRLRRAMATFRRVGTIQTFQDKMVNGMVARGYEKDFAERCFKQIEGFGEYGFPESHAASFALLVYASCWLKARYPDVFCAAMLNSQPMGFYAPAQLVRDAREHGVDVREVDINLSRWDATLEPDGDAWRRLHPCHKEMQGTIKSEHAVRLGLRSIKGLAQADIEKLVAARGRGYDSVRDLWLRTGLSRSVIAKLAEADAFRSLGLDRRGALWAAQGLEAGGAAERLPLFDRADLHELRPEPDVNLPPMLPGEHIMADYQSLTLSLKGHPVSFVRNTLARARVVMCADLQGFGSGRKISVAGLVLVRQRPGSAKGVIFMTVEDEGGIANVIVWPKCFEKYRALVLGTRFIKVTGRLQNAEGVIHVIAEHLEDMTDLLGQLSVAKFAGAALAHADEVRRPVIELAAKIQPGRGLAKLVQEVPEVAKDFADLAQKARQVLPGGRNFH